MNGKVARAIRRVSGYKAKQMRGKNTYKPVPAKHFFRVNEKESEKMGETRLEIDRTAYTFFSNNAARAVYRYAKKRYTKREV